MNDANDNLILPADENLRDKSTNRVASIDVYRGMVMFLMLAELLHLEHLADIFPGHDWLEWLRFHTTHVQWEGCSIHDLIQPSFTFLVGVALPFSLASRIRHSQTKLSIALHALFRSIILIVLGIVLRSLGRDQTNFTFEDTLTQIGLGYVFVAGVALWLPKQLHFAVLGLVLAGFFGLYAVFPAPPPDFDYASVGVPVDWPHHHEGFASRFNKNSNISWRFDTWFMNLFPREDTFLFNSGGYATLSFIPTMGTMLIGLIAGGWMQGELSNKQRLIKLVLFGIVLLTAGWLLALTDLCPLVKRIWTPSFALYSGGCCLLWLAALNMICDWGRWRTWAFPFVVIGANSILIYVMSWTVADPIREMLFRHFGRAPFSLLGDEMIPFTSGALTMLVLFCVLLWLYRRKIFVKI